ncbi:RNA polymerase sigma-70 factor [Rhabdobacter roseus]|uniref:RNA polymerase sigma-70 factor (ECF subfamily) n=1 Tax=Rhabdobacter roseus TaxID=1655419 RepID=A0A840TNY3_9BACT|nr:sigma-70 family RNA polymerase sigma factor [Rhabdobacter roseus]MBB5282923.1 RNA polymerase sigma-70 factor (ECF subfamily) [Rhabdobacter roseus]
MESNPESEQELIAALQNGDQRAFTTIYKTYWYRMFLVAYRKLQHREIAEELIQDIFTRLWKERATMKITQLDAYLFSAVRYEIIDHIRSKGPVNAYVEYYQAFSPLVDRNTEHTIAYNDLIETLDKGMDFLPEKSKLIFRLSRLENWPVPQIAQHVNLSEKAVEYHLTKASKAIRLYLEEAYISLLLLSYAVLL